MPFGNKVVTAVSKSDGPTPGALGTYPQVESAIDLPGCRHRPLTFRETAELEFDIATEHWKTTIPLHEYSQALIDAVKALEPDAVIRVDGREYQVIAGARPHDDFTSPFKATIISKKVTG